MKLNLNKRTMVSAAGGIFLLMVGLGVYLFIQNREEEEGIFFEPVKAELASCNHILTFRGALKSMDSLPIAVRTNGRIQTILSQGSEVKKGDLICQMDDTDAVTKVENLDETLSTMELELEQLQAQYELLEYQENRRLGRYQAALAHARLEESEELKQPDAREKRLMEIEEKLAFLDLEDARERYERERSMYDKKYITLSALEPYERKYENAKATLEELMLKNAITRKGITEERRVELRKAVERAQANLERMEAHKVRRLKNCEAQIQAKSYDIEVIKYDRQYIQREIDGAKILAERDGIFMLLVYRDWTSGGTMREIMAGDQKYLKDVIGYIINPRKMAVKFVINESDYPYVSEGMAAALTFPAIPRKVFMGKIVQLGAKGKERNMVDPTMKASSAKSEISVFNSTIDFDGQGLEFHPGMSVKISIEVAKPEAAIYIPRGAVYYNDEGEPFVYLDEGRRSVKITGHSVGALRFAVKTGVSNGECVYIRKRIHK